MEIKGKVHLFFEQSGTFKNEFKKLGYEAYDYDIQNNFNETDYQIDLFKEIENAYGGGGQSVFDTITPDDLIIAVFPCIYFCAFSQVAFNFGNTNYRTLTDTEKIKEILKRSGKRTEYYNRLLKLIGVVLQKGLRMIFENPWSEQTYLKQNVFLKSPSFVDKDRTLRGDYMKKPTAYWFWNCEPTTGCSYQPTHPSKVKRITDMKKAPKAGLCSEERSMISPDYARNFICDFIIGKTQTHSQMSLFDPTP